MDGQRLSSNLYRFESGCNVYVVRDGARAVAIDFGDGRWLAEAPAIGVGHLDAVFLTHHHADQWCPSADWRSSQLAAETVVHAPAGDEPFLDPERAAAAARPGTHLGIGCPSSYSVPPQGAPGVVYDIAGFSDLFWGSRRVRLLHTPGHTTNACSVLMDVDGRQVLFAGDAAHARGTVWEPWHLEWDHWTGSGALAAWEGIERLRGVAVDLLCPAHGPWIRGRRPSTQLLTVLSSRLRAFYAVKGRMSAPRPDLYVEPLVGRLLGGGARPPTSSYRQYTENLYQFGTNGYLLRSRGGEALVVDPTVADIPALDALLADIGRPRIAVCLVSHYHFDHCDGAGVLRARGARLILHPWVAEPLHDVRKTQAPWLPLEDVLPDELWPESGEWVWNEYAFRVAPFPGQTLWHCLFAAQVDGRRIAFVGDTFQPASRWNGTGGFCAYNRSLFRDGFARSAKLLIDWAPDWLAAGHGTVTRFQAGRFREVIRWSRRAERAVRALCPTGSLERDYYAWGSGGRRAR